MMNAKVNDLLKNGTVLIPFWECSNFIQFAWYRRGISVKMGDRIGNDYIFVEG